LLSLFVLTNFPLGLVSIFLSHVMFNIAFVAVTVRARLAGFHREIEEAAQDLYADPLQTFTHVTLPLIWPGITSMPRASMMVSRGPEYARPTWTMRSAS
jgi:spermidine/putrescine transport system permease protein